MPRLGGRQTQPRGIRIDDYHQPVLLLVPTLGFAGFVLSAISLAITCFGAALEITLALAYLVAQGFGWSWGENKKIIEQKVPAPATGCPTRSAPDRGSRCSLPR